MTPVADIMKAVSSSSDIGSFDGGVQGWMDLINDKANDSGFWRLIDSILENGWEEGSVIGIREGYIHQGHHRLVAAVLLGLDEAPVSGDASSPATLSAYSGNFYGYIDFFEDVDFTELTV